MDLISELASRRIMLQEMNYSEADIIDNFREYIYNNGTYTDDEIDEIIQNFYIASDIEVDQRLFERDNNENSQISQLMNLIVQFSNNNQQIISATVSRDGSLQFLVRDRNIINEELEDVKVTLDDKDLEKIESKVLDKKIDDNCSICLDSYKEGDDVSILKCNHIFHKNCIQTYLKEYNHKCPLCKKSAGQGKANI
jgi:hypothetical protein